MGVYNTYGNTQLKINEGTLKEFKIGDKVDISDGVYVGHEGVVVIKEGKMTSEFDNLTTKWGSVVTPEEVLQKHHPLRIIR